MSYEFHYMSRMAVFYTVHTNGIPLCCVAGLTPEIAIKLDVSNAYKKPISYQVCQTLQLLYMNENQGISKLYLCHIYMYGPS